jgi:hypothetical protein
MASGHKEELQFTSEEVSKLPIQKSRHLIKD